MCGPGISSPIMRICSLLNGRTVVQLSTDTLKEAREASQWMIARRRVTIGLPQAPELSGLRGGGSLAGSECR